MADDTTAFVGLDVHKDTIAIGVAECGREAPRFLGTCGPQLRELLRALGTIGPPQQLHLAYEAGPCGYDLARALMGRGYHCEVIAVTKTPRRPGDRVKTDRRDALSLARYLRSAELTAVHIPDVRDEAIRDLSRTREDAVRSRLKARQQLKALLLRQGHRYEGKTSWTVAHQRYLGQIAFEHPAQGIAFAEYRNAVTEADERVTRLTEALRAQVQSWRGAAWVSALMSLRGLDFIAAATIAAELGDLRRFAHPKQLMAFLGLVPSEYSSGESRRQGAITKCGNSHVRRMLIESAWSYRYPARMSRELTVRNEGQPPSVRAIAWQAQLRLCGRYKRLEARGLHKNRICVAIARELCGFIWDLGQHTPSPH